MAGCRAAPKLLDDPRLRIVRQAQRRRFGRAQPRHRRWPRRLGGVPGCRRLASPRIPRAHLRKAHSACPEADVLAAGFIQFNGSEAVTTRTLAARRSLLRDRTDRGPARALDAKRGIQFTAAWPCAPRRLRQMRPCFVEGESLGEDLDLWFRIADETPIALVQHAAGRLPGRGVRAACPTNRHHWGTAALAARMRQRALSGACRRRHRQSALWFVAQQEITLARDHLVAGRPPPQALRTWCARGIAAAGRRWQLTACHGAVDAGQAGASRWQRWRIRSRRCLLAAGDAAMSPHAPNPAARRPAALLGVDR